MRFLHAADWHLGRLFHQVHLTDDQDVVLRQLVQISRDARVGAVVVAGDVYDRAVPPPEAVRLLDDALAADVERFTTALGAARDRATRAIQASPSVDVPDVAAIDARVQSLDASVGRKAHEQGEAAERLRRVDLVVSAPEELAVRRQQADADFRCVVHVSDVVQAYAAGIRLETIFVDEGFGSLDEEALDTALETLMKLGEGGRLVGIISHVPELRTRIDARLEVMRSGTGTGSTAEFVM